MSIFLIRDYLKKYPGEVLRLALLSGHYRQSLNWTDESIEQAHSMLNRIYRVLKKVEDVNINETNHKQGYFGYSCQNIKHENHE